MNSTKRYLGIALSFAICMTVFAAFAPRIAHAITATLVQVVNTSSNPVPTPDSATRFAADICEVTGSTASASGYCNGANKFTVPATTSAGLPVKRLIVDNVSGVCDSYNNDPTDLAILGIQLSGSFPADSVPNGAGATHYVPVMPASHSYVNAGSNIPETDYIVGQTTRFAFNPGDTVSMISWWSWTGNGPLDYWCVARVEGYLVTQ